LDFEHLVPKSVSKVHGKVIVGEQVKLEFKDDTSMVVRILELSELQHFVTWEMVECTPAVTVTSVINKIKLCRVTDMNATFMTWETEFSNDADMSLYQDQKAKKLEYFIEMKRVFGQQVDVPTVLPTTGLLPTMGLEKMEKRDLQDVDVVTKPKVEGECLSKEKREKIDEKCEGLTKTEMKEECRERERAKEGKNDFPVGSSEPIV